MDIVLSTLKDNEILVILCDAKARGQMHEYLRWNYPKLGHVGILLPIFDYEITARMRCGMCDRWQEAEAHSSDLPNNYGLAWSSYCANCDASLWDDEYYHESDSYKTLITHDRNNAIIINAKIQVAPPYRRPIVEDLSESVINRIFAESHTMILQAPPGFYLHGSQGRCRRGKLARRKETLATYLVQQIRGK